MPRVVPAVLALVLLSSCGGAPVADTTLRAPEPGKAVLLLYVGANTFPFFSNSQVVTTAGDLSIIAYSPSEGVRTDGAMARFSISSPLAGGFRAVTVQPGTYAILGIALYPLWSMCLNKGSLAFEAKPGVITYLGRLDTMAYVTRLRDFALGHPPQGNHPHLNQRRRQVDATSFAPQGTDLAEARAFADAQLGHGTVVQPADFSPAAWATQDNWAGVDECAITPAKK